jgi:DNA-binding CsgD family transcriptional regulator
MLDALGLTAEQEALYRAALAQTEPQAVTDLARLAGVAEEVSAEICLGLQSLGLLRLRADGSASAVPPQLALQPLAAQRLALLEQAKSEIARLSWEYQCRQGVDVDSSIDVIRSPTEAWRCFQQFQSLLQHQFRGFDTPPYVNPEVGLNQGELDALGRGVTYRVVYARASIDRPGGLETLETYHRAGELARVTVELPFKVSIHDDELAMLTYGADSPERFTAMVIRPSPILTALNELFEYVWRSATPVQLQSGASGCVGSALSPADLRLVTLLSVGFKDEAVGRQLGISERTVQRRLHRLLETFRVRSRQQLLLLLAQQGRLPPVPSAASRDPGTPLRGV